MRKFIIIIITIIFAFSINELFVRLIIGYPTFGLETKVKGIKSPYSTDILQNLYKPHSKYWNVEGGNIVETRNNYGLPGVDIKIENTSKIIYLLGDSYLEGIQVRKNDMAVSIFQKMLKSVNQDFVVINLAYSGHDPYDLYFRMKYFEKIFGQGYVMLVLQDDKTEWLKRHSALDFNMDKIKVSENASTNYNVSKILRNNFASINLFRYLFVNSEKEDDNEPTALNKINDNRDNKNNYVRLDSVITQYRKDYGGKFIFVSISSDSLFNKHTEMFCTVNNINYYHKDLMSPELRFSGKGHLNELGNRKLGEFLYDSLKDYLKHD